MKQQDLNHENDFFTAERIDALVMLTFKRKRLVPVTLWSTKTPLFEYLDKVSKSDAVKVVVVMDRPGRSSDKEYADFYDLIMKGEMDKNVLWRMCTAYDQFIMKIVESNKLFINVGYGKTISQDFHVALACDYRMVADDTVIHKPYLDRGLVPKGGGAYFLEKRLGHARALEILLSNKPISAHEALELGLVNEVIPREALTDSALKKARYFAQQPASSLSGTKKLLNHSLKELKQSLDLENRTLVDIVNRKIEELR
jgi:2-(1,2-epoxy-1,2-dihydrophenyl)acetyl-CoA isomerase